MAGFTIIEVVLVLAIAGLIFLAMFIALPALQRSQRDAQRRTNLSLLVDAIERYKANTGNYPRDNTELRNLAANYLDYPGDGVPMTNGKTFVDPESGLGYRFWAYTDGSFYYLRPGYIDNITGPTYTPTRLIYYEVDRGCPEPSNPENSIPKPGTRILWQTDYGRRIFCIEF